MRITSEGSGSDQPLHHMFYLVKQINIPLWSGYTLIDDRFSLCILIQGFVYILFIIIVHLVWLYLVLNSPVLCIDMKCFSGNSEQVQGSFLLSLLIKSPILYYNVTPSIHCVFTLSLTFNIFTFKRLLAYNPVNLISRR